MKIKTMLAMRIVLVGDVAKEDVEDGDGHGTYHKDEEQFKC